MVYSTPKFNDKHFEPVQNTERAPILDVLRGIAIFGIFINNIYGFSGYGVFFQSKSGLKQ